MTTSPIARRRRTPIGRKQSSDPASVWIRQTEMPVAPDTPERASFCTARLTIDVTLALQGRIKVRAFERGVTASDMLRELLEREFNEEEG